MKTHLTISVLLALLIASLNSATAAKSCVLSPASPTRISREVDEIKSRNQQRIIHILGVDMGDGRSTPLHAGPVEVFDAQSQTICKANVELLHPPFMLAQDRYFYFLSGDAVDVAVKVIDLNTCQVAWQSQSFTWDRAPRLTTKALVLRGKKVAIRGDCLPAKGAGSAASAAQ